MYFMAVMAIQALINISLNINMLQNGIAIASPVASRRSNMEDLRGIIREAIEVAKVSGLWQSLSLKEKEKLLLLQRQIILI